MVREHNETRRRREEHQSRNKEKNVKRKKERNYESVSGDAAISNNRILKSCPLIYKCGYYK